MSDQQASAKQVTMHIKPELHAGTYANLATVTITKNEVVLDFAFLSPSKERADVVSRVVMTPTVAKNFVSAFQNAVIDFEKKTNGSVA